MLINTRILRVLIEISLYPTVPRHATPSELSQYYWCADSCLTFTAQTGIPAYMRNTFPSFSPQPQHVSYHRFNRHYSVISVFQTSPRHRKLVIPVLPKQVSHRIDRWFISSYSPPYLTATQLLSISEFMAYSGVDLHHSDVTPSRAYDPANESRDVEI